MDDLKHKSMNSVLAYLCANVFIILSFLLTGCVFDWDEPRSVSIDANLYRTIDIRMESTVCEVYVIVRKGDFIDDAQVSFEQYALALEYNHDSQRHRYAYVTPQDFFFEEGKDYTITVNVPGELNVSPTVHAKVLNLQGFPENDTLFTNQIIHLNWNEDIEPDNCFLRVTFDAHNDSTSTIETESNRISWKVPDGDYGSVITLYY
ncbi:MAG: hypothetical protein P9L92_15835 [Candidatus Electryonea clarkiae]|nr:hypothetical protein [Candidatus Electryonea clarkiae]MDP8285781.1 hypothetical protein [Candidatus Electryonea clarkiae]